MSERVSVIIPTYNRARFIARAIRSALEQLDPSDEVIVVDDGSTDNTHQVVSQFGGAVRYERIPNGGPGRARNVGITLAYGELVAFLDSDDEWFPGKIQLQRRLMAVRPDLLFSFSNFAVTFADGGAERNYLHRWLTGSPTWEKSIGPGEPYSHLTRLPKGMADFPVHIGDLSAAEMLDNYLLTSSVVVRRREAGDALRFAEDLCIYEDWYCFARLSLLGKGAYLDCETTWQHGLAETRVSSAGKLDRARCWRALYDRIWSQDREFRRQHAEHFARTLASQQLAFVRALIAAGDTKQARQLLAALEKPPHAYRLMACLPGWMISRIANARHWLKQCDPRILPELRRMRAAITVPK